MEQNEQATPAGTSCPDCHALVTDLGAHKHWHSRLVADIAKAVDREDKHRHVAG